jgi:CBS domain-containing membrane protein
MPSVVTRLAALLRAVGTRARRGLRAAWPAPLTVSRTERLRACGGALFGLALTGGACRLLLGPGSDLPLLIAPMGASAVLLFGVPASPLAQPWPVLGGNVLAALVGTACALFIPDPLLAAPLAVALAIGGMLALRCLHPPGGAIALMAALGGPALRAMGWGFALVPVGLNSALLLLAALAFNNLTGRRYPHAAQAGNGHGTKDPEPAGRLGFTAADLDAVLSRYDQVLDIARDDLEMLFRAAERQSYHRRLGELCCADIMSRDIVAVEFGTPLEEAWQLLRRHRLNALPVLDRARRVIGIITTADFLRHGDLDRLDGLRVRLRQVLRPAEALFSDKPEVVGQLMTAPARSVAETTPIVELVPLMASAGLHQVPVVDAERRLAGMVAQPDLVAALYRGRLAEAEAASAALAA